MWILEMTKLAHRNGDSNGCLLRDSSKIESQVGLSYNMAPTSSSRELGRVPSFFFNGNAFGGPECAVSDRPKY